MKISPQQRRKQASIVQGQRNELGWTQEDLARAADCTLSYIQKVENAVRGGPRIISKLLGVMAEARAAARNGNDQKSA